MRPLTSRLIAQEAQVYTMLQFHMILPPILNVIIYIESRKIKGTSKGCIRLVNPKLPGGNHALTALRECSLIEM